MRTEFLRPLQENDTCVLATCVDNEVSARKVCYVIVDEKIYFLTDRRTRKSKDIRKNQRISVCVEDLQIQGTAQSLGHPLLASNSVAAEAFCKRHRFFFQRTSTNKGAELFEITPETIKQWRLVKGRDTFLREKFNRLKKSR